MQISRHWRLNAQRYRLEGFRNNNGELSLQRRPSIENEEQQYQFENEEEEQVPAVAH